MEKRRVRDGDGKGGSGVRWIWGGRYVGEGCGFGEENGSGKRDGLWRGEVWEEDGLEKEMGFSRKMV